METLLRDQRVRRALSVTDIARRLDVHPNSVLRWERRERLPGPDHLRELATLLAVEVSSVASFFDEVRPPAGRSEGVPGPGLRPLRHAAGVSVRRIARHVGTRESTPTGPRAPAPPLRRHRRRTGLSQEAVARRIGTTRRRVGAWERGEVPPLWAVRRLASLYGVPASHLASLTGLRAPLLLDPANWRAGDLPEILRTLRSWNGLTQAEAARRCGLHPTTLRAWERGRAVPSERSRARIERLHGLAAGALLPAYPSEG